MNPGDLISQDRQAELRGVLIGEGTDYQIDGWDLFAAPEVATKDTQRNDQGVQSGTDRYGSRLLTIDLWLDSFPDLVTCQADRAALEAAFRPGPDDVQLHFRLQGVQRCYIGRPRGISTTLPSLDAWEVEARFLATDPRLFSSTEHRHVFDGSPATLTNAGTRDTPWVWTVPGPCIHPMLWRTDDPTSFTWAFPDLELDDGDVLIVDSRTGRATVNGGSVIGQARDDSGNRLPYPFSFPAGAVEWMFDADGDAGNVDATLTWRDAWA